MFRLSFTIFFVAKVIFIEGIAKTNHASGIVAPENVKREEGHPLSDKFIQTKSSPVANIHVTFN
jgi:hypothetical protein